MHVLVVERLSNWLANHHVDNVLIYRSWVNAK